MQALLVRLFGSNEPAVQKIEAIDKHQRKLGHDLRSIQMRIAPLRRLVEQMRGEQEKRHHG